MSELISVKVPFSKRTVEVTEADWRACQRMDNLFLLLGLVLSGVLFVGGLSIQGLQPLGVLAGFLTMLVYFDGYVSRWCAARKAAK